MRPKKITSLPELIFVTSNRNKLAEVQAILSDHVTVRNKKVNLTEIQAVEVSKVIQKKTADAYQVVGQPLLCEDTGLSIEAMSGLPGALIKLFIEKLSLAGLTKWYGGEKAYAQTVFGYHDGEQMHFFNGRIDGIIAPEPQGEGFSWDSIFIPTLPTGSQNQTFGQMPKALKNKISMRSQALTQFIAHLKSNPLPIYQG